ncbi:MAG: hypothetical protein VX044_03005 [Planctomycetota bacterium]|nr:hypothetical protein [Planctomycetota bacterium]
MRAVGEIVLLTDGEDFGAAAARAAAVASAAGHRVHCVGYGSAGGSKVAIAGADGQESFLTDAAGVEIVTRFDAAGLAAVAAAGGGDLYRALESSTLVSLWREVLVPASARRRMAAGDVDVVDRFWWPLFAGALLWMLRMCLPERRR